MRKSIEKKGEKKKVFWFYTASQNEDKPIHGLEAEGEDRRRLRKFR